MSTVALSLGIDDPSIHIDGGKLHITNFTETDDAVVRVIGEAQDRIPALHRSAGENSVSAVTFQLPLTVKVAKIEWSADGGLGDASAEWQVPVTASSATTGTGPWAVIQAYYNPITARTDRRNEQWQL